MGTYFKTTSQLYAVFDAFFDGLRTDESVASHVLQLGANLRFFITSPEGEMTVDTISPGGRVIMGPSNVPCEIVMRMTADAGHRFWLGELSLLSAVTRREIVVEQGSLTKILKLLPVLKPAHAIYQQVLDGLEGNSAGSSDDSAGPPAGG